MDYLNRTIEEGAKIAGDQKQLEATLGLARGYITEVKAGRRGLPTEACFKLAEMTGADLARMIASSEAITAKKPEKVAYWKKKLVELESLAACLIVACVISVVTPTPSQAVQLSQVPDSTLYIM